MTRENFSECISVLGQARPPSICLPATLENATEKPAQLALYRQVVGCYNRLMCEIPCCRNFDAGHVLAEYPKTLRFRLDVVAS
jgi:hypothetical protein